MIRLLLRAAIWKATPQARPVRLSAFALCVLASVCGKIAYEYAVAGPGVYFTPYGLNSLVALTALTSAAAVLFVRAGARMSFLAALLLLSLPLLASSYIATMLAPAAADAAFRETPLGGALFVSQLVWWIGATSALMRSFEPERRYAVPRAVGLWVALFAIQLALPSEPAFRGDKFDMRSANLWEAARAWRGDDAGKHKVPQRQVDRAQTELAQAALLERQIGGLAPQVDGATDIYAIGVAGWSDQDVFGRELAGALFSLDRIFPLRKHVVRLVNHPDAVAELPSATVQNISAAIRGIAKVMNRDEDVLLIFLTSHGSQSGVSLLLRGAYFGEITPTDLKAIFDREGIKNRVVIVSSCYSGNFVAPLADDNTIVMTAADATHTSFGCADKREWTYFGDAFFNLALKADTTLDKAFAAARVTIGGWEEAEKLEPSNPQGHFGAALVEKLAPLYWSARSASVWGPNPNR